MAQAAERLGVSVSGVQQRIADGSLVAHRIGSQWVVDELSVVRVQERGRAGRPLSLRSAWAVIAASEGDRDRLRPSGSTAWVRARRQLSGLLESAVDRASSEDVASALAVSLRSIFRKRAQRRLFRAASADLDELRADERWAQTVDLGPSGIASTDVEGYRGVESGWRHQGLPLVETDRDANVVLHLIPDGQYSYPGSRLRLAADLAEHRGPREEARAAELLHELASEWKAAEQ